MLIGVPKEIKVHEYRVGLLPASAREAVAAGHRVIVEAGAAGGIGHPDAEYLAIGAEVVDTAEEVFARADLIVKVKEPQPHERRRLREGQVLFAYLHLAPDPAQTSDLMAGGAVCIAYETVTSSKGGLPLLAPMSEVAGRMALQAGARCLEKEQGGRGILPGGVPGVAPAKVSILGGGVVGANAALIAVGMGADVTVLDRDTDRLRHLAERFEGRLKCVHSNVETVESYVVDADLVIGAVLVPGAEAPKLIPRALMGRMKPGSAFVDVSIDQGGCAETSRPTTHADPTYLEEGVVHYCVTNMPGAVPHTSSYALNNATLPFVLALAGKGWRRALKEDRHLAAGLNVARGKLTCRPVAEGLGLMGDYVEATEMLMP
ncbi:MAG: alanine dehydrogenase [Magnetospirillum sp. WYHS-4]